MNPKIQITANGESFQIDANTPLPQFLESIELSPDRVVVERNKIALTPSEAQSIVLEEADRLEIVRIVAGG